MHLCNNWSLRKWISYFYILSTLVVVEETLKQEKSMVYFNALGFLIWKRCLRTKESLVCGYTWLVRVRVGLCERWYLQDIDSFLMQIVFFVRNPWKKVWYEFISSPLASWCLILQKQHCKINLLYLSYFTIWLIIVQDWVGVVM